MLAIPSYVAVVLCVSDGHAACARDVPACFSARGHVSVLCIPNAAICRTCALERCSLKRLHAEWKEEGNGGVCVDTRSGWLFRSLCSQVEQAERPDVGAFVINHEALEVVGLPSCRL